MGNLSEEIVVRFLQNKCNDDDLSTINDWLDKSEEHAGELFKTEEVYHLGKAKRYNDSKVVARAESDLMKRIHRMEKQENKVHRIQSVMRYAAIIALVLIGSGVATWLYSTASKANYVTVTSTIGVKKLILSDGTKVWLNKGAKLIYPRQFLSERRNVELTGEAYFEVTKNRHKPFIVQAEKLSIEVLGTTFNCQSNSAETNSVVSLIEGKVKVRGNNNEGLVVLEPGQKAELNHVTHNLVVRQSDTRLDAVWHDGLIPFRSASIPYIAKVLERFYHVKIIISPEITGINTYSGSLSRRNSINEVLDLLKNSIPINYRVLDKDKVFISLKK